MPAKRSLQVILAAVLAAASAGEGGQALAGSTLWTSPRATPGGRAVCLWPEDGPPPEVREWHFRSKSNRSYRVGLAVWASPAIVLVNGRPTAFIGGYDQTMHALDLVEKRRVWRRITNGEIAAPPAVGLVGGQQVVFWGSADRTVYAFFADAMGKRDGRRLWTRELVPTTPTLGKVKLSAPLLADGKLFITCFVYDRALARSDQKGWLFALKADSGRILWQQEVSQGPVSSPCGREINGRLILFVAAQKGLLQAFDASGPLPERLWTYQMPHEVLGSPVVEEDGSNPLLFLGSKFGDLHAINAITGQREWRQMCGNWIDNSACIGEVDGERHVFVGSHDYKVYCFGAATGDLRWKRHLGGEVYSAPAFFHHEGRPLVAAASLDNHLYVLDASNGDVVTSYYTGQPIWDKVSKGETLWGSPAVLEAGAGTAIVHGSFNNFVYTYPLNGECELRTKVRSATTLWWGLLITLIIFCGGVLPVVLLLPGRKREPLKKGEA